jgi:hypothetical protein
VSSKTNFTMGALKAAKLCQSHIKSVNYSFAPEEAAVDLDKMLRLPELIALMNDLVDEAKRDLASSPNWTGPTVRISRSKIKELSYLISNLEHG